MPASPSVRCADCGRVLDEPPTPDPAVHEPCPDCGATNRALARNAEDSLGGIHEQLRLVQKGKRPGVHGRRLLEVKSGASRSADGTWAEILQVVDRIRRRYRKRVVAEDGRVLRDVDVPLEEHQGDGSAKRKPE